MKLKSLALLLCIGCAGQSKIETAVQLPQPTVHWSGKVTNNLIHIYNDRRLELPVCLFGKKRDNKYYIEDYQLPYISSSTDTSATFNLDICHSKDDYLGLVHNHKKTSEPCTAGTTDLYRFLFIDERAKIEEIVCYVDFPKSINVSTLYKETISNDLKTDVYNLYHQLNDKENDKNEK